MQKYLKSKETGRPKIFAVSSVSEFVDVATWLDDDVIFRGQTREDWPLIPAVGRHVEGSQVPWREREILEEFKRESVPYLDFLPANDWQWLAVAQHNRLPTRLLDWTKNSLAALWFAVSAPAIDDKPGVVWAFLYEGADVVVDTRGLHHPFSVDRPHVYLPEHIFPFIQAQSGVFTVHNRKGTNPGTFPPLEEMKDADLRLIKIQISPKSFSSIRYHLFRVGVSPASLFPGLSGLVDRIRYDNMVGEDEKSDLPPNKAAAPDAKVP